MKKFENKVVFINDEETKKEVINICNKYRFKLGNFVFNLSLPFYLYSHKSLKRFNGIKENYCSYEEITLEEFKELLKQTKL